MDYTDFLTRLFKKTGGKYFHLILDTIASKVKMADGTTVEDTLTATKNQANVATYAAGAAQQTADNAYTAAQAAQEIAHTKLDKLGAAQQLAGDGLNSDENKLNVEGFLPLTGGDLSGPLTVKPESTYPHINIKFKDIDLNADLPQDASWGGLYFLDKNGAAFTAIDTGVSSTEVASRVWSSLPNASSGGASLGIHSRADGINFATAPNPRGLYGNDIVTENSLKNYAPGKSVINLTLHVNANHPNASDTADIFVGRGSEDMPFASLHGAIGFAIYNMVGPTNIYIILHSNDVLDEVYYINVFPSIYITGATGNEIVDIPTIAQVLSGLLIFNNIHIRELAGAQLTALQQGSIGLFNNVKISRVGNTAAPAMTAMHNGLIEIMGDLQIEGVHTWALNAWMNGKIITTTALTLTINGTYTIGVVGANVDSAVDFNSGTVFSGSPTGKRFGITSGSKVLTFNKGVNFIPGTEAGIVDSTSVYY